MCKALEGSHFEMEKEKNYNEKLEKHYYQIYSFLRHLISSLPSSVGLSQLCVKPPTQETTTTILKTKFNTDHLCNIL